MRLNIKNVGKVDTAEIELNGITVIGGYKNTGKTTVLRSADLMLKTYHNLNENIRKERVKSMLNSILRQGILFDKNGIVDLSYRFLEEFAQDIMIEIEKNRHALITWVEFYALYNDYLNLYVNELGARGEDKKLADIAGKIYEKLQNIAQRDASSYERYLAE